MAVPGRKVKTLTSAECQGSAEDYDRACDACLTSGQNVEAHGYCVDCKDYLCITCFRTHGKNRASRHHKLLDNTDSVQAKSFTSESDSCIPTDAYLEECPIHANERIKFFCEDHCVLGCNDCITLEHRSCSIKYIPKECPGFSNTAEYREIVQKLDDLYETSTTIKNIAIDKIHNLEEAEAKVIKDINRFQKVFNDLIEELKRQSIKETERVKARKEGDIKSIVETCDEVISNTRQIQSSITESTAAKLDYQTYISIKRGDMLTKSHDMKRMATSLDGTDIQLNFEVNKNLENILVEDVFGNLTESSPPVPTRPTRSTLNNVPPVIKARAPLPPELPRTFVTIPRHPTMEGIPEDQARHLKPDPLGTEEWYHGEIDRYETNRRLTAIGKDGTYLVRKSIFGDDNQPYSLSVLYHDYVYNLKIRKGNDGKICLGEDKHAPWEQIFDTVPDLIRYYKMNTILLVNATDGKMHKTTLNTICCHV